MKSIEHLYFLLRSFDYVDVQGLNLTTTVTIVLPSTVTIDGHIYQSIATSVIKSKKKTSLSNSTLKNVDSKSANCFGSDSGMALQDLGFLVVICL